MTASLTETLRIKEKIQETSDSFSLVFEIPEKLKAKFQYKAGQFVTLFLDIDGQAVGRSYSLSSSPDWDQDFKISVKRVPQGLVSNFLGDHVDVGSQLQVTPPAGRFVLPKNLEGQSLVFFAAGSGITPIFSLIKSALKNSPSAKVFLLYCNRNENSIMFHRQIHELNHAHNDRFRFEYVLSQPIKSWDGPTGRVHANHIQDFLVRMDVPKNSLAYLCGPEGFMATTEAALEMTGYHKEQIIKESFASAPAPKTDAALDDIGPDAVLIGEKEKAGEPQRLEVYLGGEKIEVAAQKGMSVLETLLEAGYNPPYSCMNGSCMACLGKVQSGLVYQDDMGILTEDNTEVRECLTCQAKPASQKVVIDYDL
jgi:ring-1,2-phenylacetyl-CoA epoxidase subunit PaaE